MKAECERPSVMPRVLHLAKRFFPERGGMETVVRDLAYSLEGYPTAVLCFASKEALEADSCEPFDVKRCAVNGTFASQDISLSYLISSVRLIRSCDIIHLHLPNFWAILAIMLSPKRKLVIHWHADVVGKGALYSLLKPIERWAIKRADTILCTSNSYSEAAPALRRARDKIKILPIGIPDKEFKGKHTKRESPRLLAIGRLEQYKNYDTLIEMMTFLPNHTKLDIVGTGSLQSKLEQQINDRGLADRIVLHGAVSDSDLEDLFANATVHVLASTTRAEAFGVVLLEAMRQGVPSVCFNIRGSGVPEVNEHGVTGLVVDETSSEAFAEAVESILSDPMMERRLSEGARARFTKKYDLSAIALRYREILKSL